MTRTPVTIETEIKGLPDDMEIVGGVLQDKPVPQPVLIVVNPIVDGYRACARPGCGASFKPKSLNAKDEDVTEYYCSSDCAIHEFYRKRGLGAVPEKVVSGAESSARHAKKTERQRVRVERSAEAETKHGPLRAIAEVLATKKGSKRVRYECGHEGSVGARANRGRCRKCRVGSENRVEAEEKLTRGDMESFAQASERMKKRTPVKPPKRGKKGKK